MPLHSPVPQFPIAILNVPKLYYFFFLVIGIPLFCFKKKKNVPTQFKLNHESRVFRRRLLKGIKKP